MHETPSMGSALGGKINVTLSGDLAPLGVQIDESLMEEGDWMDDSIDWNGYF